MRRDSEFFAGNCSGKFLDNALYLLLGVGPHCLNADVAAHGSCEHECAACLIIRELGHGDDVIGPMSPPDPDGPTAGVWWTHGAYDIVTVTEFPDDEAGSAFVLAAAMGGNVRIETMRAYTEEEIQRIIQKLP